jgi:hypothetical protein
VVAILPHVRTDPSHEPSLPLSASRDGARGLHGLVDALPVPTRAVFHHIGGARLVYRPRNTSRRQSECSEEPKDQRKCPHSNLLFEAFGDLQCELRLYVSISMSSCRSIYEGRPQVLTGSRALIFVIDWLHHGCSWKQSERQFRITLVTLGSWAQLARFYFRITNEPGTCSERCFPIG